MERIFFDRTLLRVCGNNYLAVLIASFAKSKYLAETKFFPFWIVPSSHTLYREGLSWCEMFGCTEAEAKAALRLCAVQENKDLNRRTPIPMRWRINKFYKFVEYQFNWECVTVAETMSDFMIEDMRQNAHRKLIKKMADKEAQPLLVGLEKEYQHDTLARAYVDDGLRFKIAVEAATGYKWGRLCASSAARSIGHMVQDGIPLEEIRDTISKLAECNARDKYFPVIAKPVDFREKFRQIQKAIETQLQSLKNAGHDIKPSFVKIDMDRM